MKLKQMKWFEKARGSVYSFGRPYFISLQFNFNNTACRTDPPKYQKLPTEAFLLMVKLYKHLSRTDKPARSHSQTEINIHLKKLCIVG